MDLAEKALAQMKGIEEDHCLITLCNSWLTLHNPKVPLQCYDALIGQINELSDKFGYSLKTYNILGCILMIKGENEKAHKLFDAAIQENKIYELEDGDPQLQASNLDLASLLFNYIKCNALVNLSSSMASENYQNEGLQNCFLKSDELSIKLFTLLSKMESPLAKEFFAERQKSE